MQGDDIQLVGIPADGLVRDALGPQLPIWLIRMGAEVKGRPGHPMLLANLNSVPLLGLPGNPQSAIVGLMSLGQPVLNSLLGRPLQKLENVITIKEIKAREDFTRLVLGTISEGLFDEGEHLGSAMLRGLAHDVLLGEAFLHPDSSKRRIQALPPNDQGVLHR